jgi:hypothetical protein
VGCCDARVRTDFAGAQRDRVVGRVLARWHEGGVDESRQDLAAVERRNGRVRAHFGRSQLKRDVGWVLVRWHESGNSERRNIDVVLY